MQPIMEEHEGTIDSSQYPPNHTPVVPLVMNTRQGQTYVINIHTTNTPVPVLKASLAHGEDKETPLNVIVQDYPPREKIDILEERLKAIEGVNSFGLRDVADLCLVPDVVIPRNSKYQNLISTHGLPALRTI